MLKMKYKITNRNVLLGENIEQFVRKCSSFRSNISIVTKSKIINAKSIISVLDLSIIKFEESEIEIEIDGEDEKLASDVLANYLKEII